MTEIGGSQGSRKPFLGRFLAYFGGVKARPNGGGEDPDAGLKLRFPGLGTESTPRNLAHEKYPFWTPSEPPLEGSVFASAHLRTRSQKSLSASWAA